MHREIAGRLTGRVTKWLVLVFWIVAVAIFGSFGAKLTDVQKNDNSSFLPSSAESTKALDKLGTFQDPDAIPTIVAYEKKGGLSAADLAELKDQAAEFQAMEGVAGKVVGPIPSEDGEAAQTLVTYNLGSQGFNKLPTIAEKIHDISDAGGMSVYVTGQGGSAVDQSKAFEGLDSTLLVAALGVVILLLLFTYRSPMLWILPILSVVIALFTSLGIIYFLAKYAGLVVNGQSQGIVSVLVIGAGTDYALLLVARYREELRRHDDRHEAMAFALHRATPAIVASGGTVIVGMLCLTIAQMNSTAGLGPVGAIGIAVGLLAMITLLPALLVICGRWIFWPKRPAFDSAEPNTTGLWARVGAWMSPRPRKVWIGTAAALAVATLGVLTLDTSGLSNEDSYTTKVESVEGQQMLATHGLDDTSNPVLIVTRASVAEDVAAVLQPIQHLEKPSPPIVKGDTALVTSNLTVDATTPAAFRTVDDIRNAVHAVPGSEALVGGTSAIYTDILSASDRDTKVIIPITLLVVLLILMLLLRAVISPIILMATVVLSFGAALGLSALVFTHIFGFAGSDPAFPLFVFVFLVSLGIDYNIFLMTRVREETMTRGTREGSLVALSATGGVITSAGLVLAATFAVLGTLPIVFLAELGFAVALGVILDTMIVRSILVTSINLDLGSRIWWPSKLDREHVVARPDDDSGKHRADVPLDAPA